MKNPVNKVLLWFFLLPTFLYRRLGVDMPQLRAILTIKLMMDDRKPSGIFKARAQKQGKEVSMATLFTIFTSLLMGSLFLLAFIFNEELTRMTVYFGMFSFILSLLLMTDFSEILINSKDNYIILPKPVSSFTFTTARLLHILIHLTKIIVSLSIPGIIAITISRGMIGVFGLIVCIPLLSLFTFCVVNGVYLLIMKIFSPQKLNSVITAIQIIFSIFLYASFQIGPRLMDQSEMENVRLPDSVFLWLFPAYWFSNGWMIIYTGLIQTAYVIGLLLSISIPFIGLWMVIRYLAPAFFRKLSMMQGGASNEQNLVTDKTGERKNAFDLSTLMAGVWFLKGIEREAFRFTWKMTSRARDFKMKVYPQVGYILVMIGLFTFKSWKHILQLGDVDFENIEGQDLILAIGPMYACGLLFMSAILQLPYSEQYKSAWIYFNTPAVKPGMILRGVVRACLSKFFLPVVLIITLLELSLFGIEILPNLLFGLGNIFLMCTLLTWLSLDRFPFSVSLKTQVRGEVNFRNLFMLLALPFFIFPQYFLFHYPWILSFLSVITISASCFLLYYLKSIRWAQIKVD